MCFTLLYIISSVYGFTFVCAADITMTRDAATPYASATGGKFK